MRTSARFVLAGLAFPPNQPPANGLDHVHSRHGQLRPAAPVGAPPVAVVAAAAAASAVAVACPPLAVQPPSPHVTLANLSPGIATAFCRAFLRVWRPSDHTVTAHATAAAHAVHAGPAAPSFPAAPSIAVGPSFPADLDVPGPRGRHSSSARCSNAWVDTSTFLWVKDAERVGGGGSCSGDSGGVGSVAGGALGSCSEGDGSASAAGLTASSEGPLRYATAKCSAALRPFRPGCDSVCVLSTARY